MQHLLKYLKCLNHLDVYISIYQSYEASNNGERKQHPRLCASVSNKQLFPDILFALW